MRNTTKLLPIVFLGSALTGCSMAGTNDFSNGHGAIGHHGQSAQYWGETGTNCYEPQQQTTACEQAYPTAYQNATQAPYSTPAPQAYSQAVPNYQAYQGQPVYHGQQGFPQAGYGRPHSKSANSLRPAYLYGNLGATLYDVDADIYGAQARLGYQSSYFIGAEVEGSLGFTNDNSSFNNGAGLTAVSTSIDTQIAGFGVLRYPATKQINVFGRFGYHNTEGDVDLDDGFNQLNGNLSEDGIAYGGGIEYAVTPNMGVRVDYTRYRFDGPDLDSVSMAVTRKF